MIRYFKAPTETFAAIRGQLQEELNQPNGNADEPMPVEGDFEYQGMIYQSLAPHHTTGYFEPFLVRFLELPGVSEITGPEYIALQILSDQTP